MFHTGLRVELWRFYLFFSALWHILQLQMKKKLRFARNVSCLRLINEAELSQILLPFSSAISSSIKFLSCIAVFFCTYESEISTTQCSVSHLFTLCSREKHKIESAKNIGGGWRRIRKLVEAKLFACVVFLKQNCYTKQKLWIVLHPIHTSIF